MAHISGGIMAMYISRCLRRTILQVTGRSAHGPIVNAANTRGATHSAVGLPVNSSEAAAPR
jgi:hypothetical protein